MKALSAVLVVLFLAAPVAAQPGDRHPAPPAPTTPPRGWKPPVIDMGELRLDARLRTPQLMYFLERADEELERASLERRSFIPELVKTIREEAL